jgi:hypothetical protein
VLRVILAVGAVLLLLVALARTGRRQESSLPGGYRLAPELAGAVRRGGRQVELVGGADQCGIGSMPLDHADQFGAEHIH